MHRGGGGGLLAAPRHGDEARAAGGERDEAVQRLQGHGAAAAAAQVVDTVVAEAGGGESGAAGAGGFRVEAHDEAGAQLGQQVGIVCGAEVAALGDVDVVALSGSTDDGVVRSFEEKEFVGNEGGELAIDRAATMGSCLPNVRAILENIRSGK